MILRAPRELRDRLTAKPPRVAYKFFSSTYEASIRELGRVALGTQRQFRVADGITDGMNDPSEMSWVFRADRDHEWPEGHPISSHLSRMHDPNAPEVAIHVGKGTVIRLGSMAFIYCCSGVIDKVVCRRMMTRFGYDRYYRISDIDAFASEIVAADKDLWHAHVEWMRYSDEPNVSNDPTILTKPFKKARSFEWQSEIRIFFAQSTNREPRMIDVPAILPLLSFHANPEAGRTR